jgi:hypothetical protein
MGNTRRSKRDKPQGTLRVHLADNIKALRDLKYKELLSETARNKALAKDSDVSASQIQRIVKYELGTSVDHIEAIARALDTRPQDLLTPYFAAKHTSGPITLRTRRRRA